MVVLRSDRDGFSDELVVTVHGMLAGRRSMQKLGRTLEAVGYRVHHFGYPSLSGSIQRHGAILGETLADLVSVVPYRKIHLVTHSMGGIVARVALQSSGFESRFEHRCGRIVMLAPPNAGSWLTRLPLGPLAAWFPQLVELSEGPTSLVRSLQTPARFSVGVIAATRDVVVRPDATHLAGQDDHVEIPTTHQRLVRNPTACEMSARFIRHGILRPSASQGTTALLYDELIAA